MKSEVDRVLELFCVKPVGSGYIDVIVSPTKADTFLSALTQLGIATHAVTLWCEASETNKQRYGCPHGMGGPVHYGMWFSELCEKELFDVESKGVNIFDSKLDPFALAQECNSLTLAYVNNGIQDRPEYSPCLAPGFWLAVPDDWKSRTQSHVP